MADVIIREVGLRDGLQLVPGVIDTDVKCSWIDLAAAAGIAEMDVTSFVPPAYLPQFADAEAVLKHALSSSILPTVLVPNLKGAKRALAAGAPKITFIVTASEAFSQANLRRSVETSLAELTELGALATSPRQRPLIIAGLSSAFGCAIEGPVPHHRVRRLAAQAAAAGVAEIVLADTVGYADPANVRRLLGALSADLPDIPIGIHLHDTRGTGLANALAAIEAGARIVECGFAGLGGCPNSPRATGNIATEDLVYMLEAMGLDTGIDLERLMVLVEDVLGHCADAPSHSHLHAAGLPKGFRPARTVRSAP
ncbi:MAG: hydroxymethylglutaryl-CoA lyase [Sphingomonas sp.]